MKKINLNLFFILFLFSSCGTDTGNPTLTNALPVNSITTVTNEIANTMCSKIRSCFNPALSDCETKIKTTAQITNQLGLNATIYPDLNSIQSAVSSSYQIDLLSKNACFQSILNVSCNATEVQQSYSSSSLEDLTQAYKLLTIDNNCSQIFY